MKKYISKIISGRRLTIPIECMKRHRLKIGDRVEFTLRKARKPRMKKKTVKRKSRTTRRRRTTRRKKR